MCSDRFKLQPYFDAGADSDSYQRRWIFVRSHCFGMPFSRGAKCIVGFFYNQLSTSRHAGHGCSSWALRWPGIAEARQVGTSLALGNSNGQSASGLKVFLRAFSVEVSPSDKTDLIKQLRERTSAPMKDVKSALVACSWDIEAAQKDLRKRGVVLASKKSSRTAMEGLLALAHNEEKAAVVELNCETDFVARNEIFQFLASSLARLVLQVEDSPEQVSSCSLIGPECLEALKISLDHPKLNGETTVQSAILEVAAMVGENIKLRRGFSICRPSHGVVSSYLHTSSQPGLGRIAGIVTLEVADNITSLHALQHVGSELAMHVVAARPLFLSKELVSSDAIENEREILKSQAESTGKPQLAIEKMVDGRLRKYLEEVVLLEQKFIVNDTITVKSLLNDLSKEVGSPVKIGNFFRMEVGEGIQRDSS